MCWSGPAGRWPEGFWIARICPGFGFFGRRIEERFFPEVARDREPGVVAGDLGKPGGSRKGDVFDGLRGDRGVRHLVRDLNIFLSPG